MLAFLEIAKKLDLTPLQYTYCQRLDDGSPFMARALAKDPALLRDVLDNLHNPYSLDEMQQFLSRQIIQEDAGLKSALRKLRQRVLARVIMRDLNGLAILQEVMQTTSLLAEYAINTAIDYLNTWLAEEYGQPLDAHGYPQALVVVGMGKLGGGELNVSSDVDLIFAYEEEGETDAENSISNHDFFTKLGKKLIAALDEATEDGFVFRVDMRLRPFGNEGVLVTNLDALEAYYQNNGREWERYAWIKGREVTGGNAVTALLKPFVYRKYLDFGAFASMRDLKLQIQRDVVKKGLEGNIKLGRGGIREIEFIAQVFQLIRGGQDSSLQVRPTLQVLGLLKDKGLLEKSVADELIAAYVFLRNLEHRLMYLEDAQTQDLPKHEEAQGRIARAMGFVEWKELLRELDHHREIVQSHFDETFSSGVQAQKESQAYIDAMDIWNAVLDEPTATAKLAGLGYKQAEDTFRRICQLRQSHRYKQLPELSRQRFNNLLPLLIEAASKLVTPDIALIRSMDLLEAICRRASYLALLAEYPEALNLVVKLCGASAWCAQYLLQHPIVLDELLDEHTLYAAPDFTVMRQELEHSMREYVSDTERQMDEMRQFKHAAIFRFVAQDISGQLQLETLSDYLSALADLILDVALATIWSSLKFKHIERPKFAVIGYGKLGGKELGYASDLDIIFLYDDNADGAGEIYARFAQRINNWFNSQTAAGLLYETDLQLRPDGNSGLLVSSVDAFSEYQLHRAWTWEHQALTRARFVAGDPEIGKKFEKIRVEVMTEHYDAKILSEDIVAMREKLRKAQHLTVDAFDIKHSPGGIIDVEFIVQYLVLAHAAQYGELTGNLGNIALLKMLGSLGIIDAKLAEQVADAYRQYRRLQHAERLQGNMQTRVDAASVLEHAEAVIMLWRAVFLNSPT